MTIFQNLNQIPLLIGNFFSSYSLVFLFIALFLLGLFITWYEGRGEGFDAVKLFDVSFLSAFTSIGTFIVLSYLIGYTRIFRPTFILLTFDSLTLIFVTVFLVSLAPILLLCARWNWSKYRMLDIYATSWYYLAVILGVVFYLLFSRFDFLFLSIHLLLVLMIVLIIADQKAYLSGMKFSFLCIVLGTGFFITLGNTRNLIFALVLSTIGVVTLYYRYKKTMSKTTLSKEFIKKALSMLKRKEKEITDVETLLTKENSNNSLRDGLESESLDAVAKEVAKETTEAELSVLRKMKLQINKAMADLKFGKYGICEKCGKAIEPQRLRVYPEATLCMECASTK